MIKRIFDICFSILGLLVMLPLLIIVSLIVLFGSRGPVFFRQIRVGRFNRDFKIIKFRTMYQNADKMGLISMGDQDKRITPVGKYLRKFRIDELPQLINILLGDMSFVGPRPEVRKFVNYYNGNHKKILNYKPGVTDAACIRFIDIETNILNKHPDNSEEVYINEIMPLKIETNLNYFEKANIFSDIRILFLTVFKTFNPNRIK